MSLHNKAVVQRRVGKGRSMMMVVMACLTTPEPLSWIAIRGQGHEKP